MNDRRTVAYARLADVLEQYRTKLQTRAAALFLGWSLPEGSMCIPHADGSIEWVSLDQMRNRPIRIDLGGERHD